MQTTKKLGIQYSTEPAKCKVTRRRILTIFITMDFSEASLPVNYSKTRGLTTGEF